MTNHLYGRLRKMNYRRMSCRMRSRLMNNCCHRRNSCHRCMKMIFLRMKNRMMKNLRNILIRFQHFSVKALSMFPGCCMKALTLSVRKSRTKKSCFSEYSWMFQDMQNAVFLYRC